MSGHDAVAPPFYRNDVQTIDRGVAESMRPARFAGSLRKAGYTPSLDPPQDYARLLEHYQQGWLPLARTAGFSIR
jgi:hypothetical protein